MRKMQVTTRAIQNAISQVQLETYLASSFTYAAILTKEKEVEEEFMTSSFVQFEYGHV